MGCDIHFSLERLFKKADRQTTCERYYLLIIAKRVKSGAAGSEQCVVTPELFEIIIQFLPVTLTSEGATWRKCDYVEMMVCTDLDYAMRLKMHQQQSQAVAIKMQQDAKVNPEEFKKKFRIYNDLEDYFVIGDNFGYPSDFESDIARELHQAGNALTYWQRASPLLSDLRNYNRFGLWANTLRSQRELRIQKMGCMIPGWPIDISKTVSFTTRFPLWFSNILTCTELRNVPHQPHQ